MLIYRPRSCTLRPSPNKERHCLRREMIELLLVWGSLKRGGLNTTCSIRVYWYGVSRLNEETLQEGYSTCTPSGKLMRMQLFLRRSPVWRRTCSTTKPTSFISWEMEQDLNRSRKISILSSTSTRVYSQISAVLRINIRKMERKKRESLDLHKFACDMTNVMTKGTEVT